MTKGRHSISVRGETMEKLKELAQERGISVAELVTKMIDGGLTVAEGQTMHRTKMQGVG